MIWSMSDVKDGETYKLHLCQAPDGERFFRLVSVGSAADNMPAADVVLISRAVPNDLLRRRDVIGIAESVQLENGDPFYVDAHGIWLAASERAAIRSSTDWSTIEWVTKQAPKLEAR